jgi:flagellar motor switch/type III secretory pathway protein FliN
LHIDSRLSGPTLSVGDLLDLSENDVLAFDYPIGRLVDLSINGKHKFRGRIVSTGNKRAFEIAEKA